MKNVFLFGCVLCVAKNAYADDDKLKAAQQAVQAAADAAKAAEDAAKAARDLLMEANGEQPASMPAASVPATPPAPPSMPPGDTPKLKFAGLTQLSLVYLTGNSNAFTGSGGLQLSLLKGPWTFGLKGSAVYGESRAAGATRNSVTASNALGELRVQRDVAKYLGVYVLGGAAFDRVAKVENREYGELGVSVIFFKNVVGDFVKSELSLDVGGRYQHQEWYQFYPDATGPGDRYLGPQNDFFVHVGENFRYAIDKRTVFAETLDLLPDVITPADFNLNADANLSVKLVGPLSFSVDFLVKYNNLPPPGAQKLDTQLTLAANIAF